MLIERAKGYVYVPSVYWLSFVGFGVALPAVYGEWRNFAFVAGFWVVIGFMAIDATFRVTRTPDGSLLVRRGWKRSEARSTDAHLVVEHDFRSYYRVALAGGTALTGPMQLGRCMRIAEHIAARLVLPLRVPRELRDQAKRIRQVFMLIALSVGVTAALGFVGFLLWRP